jgi:hypothetical protein
MDIHQAVSIVKRLHAEKGSSPTRDEIRASGVSDYFLRRHGGFNRLMNEAGLPTYHDSKTELEPSKLRFLYIDIETSAILAHVWGLFDQNIALNQIDKDWSILSFAAKFADEDKMHYLDVRYEADIRDDSMLCVALHHLMQQADFVCAHNAAAFDVKKINARFLKHGLSPLQHYRVVDTLKIAKRNFKLTSNKLDYIASYFGIEGKLKDRKFPGQTLWNECLKRNMAAFEELQAYNLQDVLVLVQVHERIRAWDKGTNNTVFTGNECACGGEVSALDRLKWTNTGSFRLYACTKCGRQYQSRENEVSPEQRKGLLKC